MNNIKSKEPPTASATKQLNNIPEIDPRMGSLYRGSEYFQDIEFIFNTYGNFEHIKEQAYKKNTQERIHYLKTILSKYTDLEKEITSKYNHSLEEFEGYYKNLIHYCYFDDEIMSWDEEDRNKFIGMIIDNTKKYSTLFNTFWRTLKSISLLIDAESPAIKKGEIKSLAGKINWINKPELLRTHLETLKNNNFIQYDNIDSVMSGDEIAVFIKHKTYTAPCNNILALYDLWNEKKYISDYADREGKRQYKEFMENVFNWEESGKIKPVNHKSMKSIYSERIKKITEVKKHFESVL